MDATMSMKFFAMILTCGILTNPLHQESEKDQSLTSDNSLLQKPHQAHNLWLELDLRSQDDFYSFTTSNRLSFGDSEVTVFRESKTRAEIQDYYLLRCQKAWCNLK
uniref:Uncharacterized protein n=1 Tax=Kalanchoe fedtschenkoi TaxID=63787 RepID=A0A7N0SVA7_KALFE